MFFFVTLVLYMQTRNPNHEIAYLKASSSFILKFDLMTSQESQKGYSSVVSIKFISSFVLQSSVCVCHHELLYGSYAKLCNQVRSLDHFVVQNSGDFLC